MVKTAELPNNGNRIINLNPAFRKKFLAAAKNRANGLHGIHQLSRAAPWVT
jgi:hypothetical protein